jgi:hypothetical protein
LRGFTEAEPFYLPKERTELHLFETATEKRDLADCVYGQQTLYYTDHGFFLVSEDWSVASRPAMEAEWVTDVNVSEALTGISTGHRAFDHWNFCPNIETLWVESTDIDHFVRLLRNSEEAEAVIAAVREEAGNYTDDDNAIPF